MDDGIKNNVAEFTPESDVPIFLLGSYPLQSPVLLQIPIYTRLISIVSKPINPISYSISIPTMLRGAGVKFTPQLKTHLGVIDSNFIKHTYKPMSN